ncbi:hypothetical protein GW17_00059371 [Ensete ventricosum]|nr:hypothetical protein GW17_00059371 [Ensete ventricosum]
MEIVATDENREAEVGDAGGEGERESYYHIVSTIGGGIKEDEVEDNKDKNTKEDDGSGDHYVLSVRLIDAHPPETRLGALKLVVSMGETTCL